MSAPASRPVHPCVLSLTEGTRGVEYSTWAHITSRLPELPNLVTASASSLSVYSLDEETGNRYTRIVDQKGTGENNEMDWLIKDTTEEKRW